MDKKPAIGAVLASVVHVGIRLTVLPALVLTSVPSVPLAPLALWPKGFLSGAAVVPVPGGGGAVEMAFRATLGDAIPPQLLAASLVWWRFYTFYIYIALGAIAAGTRSAVSSILTSTGKLSGKYALCTYCRTIRCVLKKLPFSEIADRITSAYANGNP